MAAIVAIAVFAAACGGGSKSGPGPVMTAVPGRLTAGQVQALEKGVTAPGVSVEAAIVAAEVRPGFLRAGRSLLPAGSALRIDAASFRQTNAGTAAVTATVTGPGGGRWLLLLVREDGRWLLIGTRRPP
ncbi:MAG TPA: hypothetical protein VMV92_04310 [Streptosporangiaceae bacterium]|nr:hypothetical protein [Streptosporangiaceae bacterium]